MGDEDQRARRRRDERPLELLDRRQVEVVRRLVEDEAARAARRLQRELGPRPLARREARAAPQHVLRVEVELREQRARLPLAQRRPRGRTTPISGSSAAKSARAWPISPKTTDGPTRRRARTRAVAVRAARRSTSTSRFRSARRSRRRSPHATSRSSGPRRNAPRSTTASFERHDEVARSPRRREIEPQLPRLPGLLDPVALQPLDPLRRGARLRHQRVRARAGSACLPAARACSRRSRCRSPKRARSSLHSVKRPLVLRRGLALGPPRTRSSRR